jgi:hypothetical protein
MDDAGGPGMSADIKCTLVESADDVSLSIQRTGNTPLSFPGRTDRIWFSMVDLAKKTDWPAIQAKVLGTSLMQTTSMDSTQRTSMDRPWKPDTSQPGIVAFYPPKGSQLIDKLSINFSNIKLKPGEDAQVTLEIHLVMGGQDSPCPSGPIPLAPDPPKITKFRAFPSVLVAGEQVRFEWDGNIGADQLKLVDEHGAEPPKDSPLQIRQAGLSQYHLIARRGKTEARKTVQVKAFNGAQWASGAGWWGGGQVAGLILSQEGDRLYAIVRESASETALWWSPDGFSVWEQIDAAVPEAIATSPGVSFNGKLWFVGGSKIDPNLVSNELYQFDPESRQRQWQVFQPRPPWAPRMGHACVVFKDRLWVMGGVDAHWNALNDAWVWDGKTWHKQELPTPSPLARCLFGAASATALWIGGGFQEPDGKPCPDLWTWQGTAWTQVRWPKDRGSEALHITDGALPASTIAVLKDEHQKDEHQREQVHIVGYRDIFFRLRKRADGYDPDHITNYPPWPQFKGDPSRLESVAFNGCIWLFAQGYRGRDLIESSALYYWVPPIATIIR